MGDDFLSAILGVAGAIIGVAIIAVLVSKNSKTGDVISSAGNAFSGIISAAVNPGGAAVNSFGLGG